MELFAKQIVNNLKPFKGLRLLSECKPSPLQGGRYFRSHYQLCFKHLSAKSLKNTSEAVDFLLRFRLGNYSFTKKRGNSLVALGCTLRQQLYRQPTKLEVLLGSFFGTKTILELTIPIFRSTHLLYLTHPLALKFFQPPIIHYFEGTIPPIYIVYI